MCALCRITCSCKWSLKNVQGSISGVIWKFMMTYIFAQIVLMSLNYTKNCFLKFMSVQNSLKVFSFLSSEFINISNNFFRLSQSSKGHLILPYDDLLKRAAPTQPVQSEHLTDLEIFWIRRWFNEYRTQWCDNEVTLNNDLHLPKILTLRQWQSYFLSGEFLNTR